MGKIVDCINNINFLKSYQNNELNIEV